MLDAYRPLGLAMRLCEEAVYKCVHDGLLKSALRSGKTPNECFADGALLQAITLVWELHGGGDVMGSAVTNLGGCGKGAIC